jgi:hypothetical protein
MVPVALLVAVLEIGGRPQIALHAIDKATQLRIVAVAAVTTRKHQPNRDQKH